MSLSLSLSRSGRASVCVLECLFACLPVCLCLFVYQTVDVIVSLSVCLDLSDSESVWLSLFVYV